jgi:hypothetical protein
VAIRPVTKAAIPDKIESIPKLKPNGIPIVSEMIRDRNQGTVIKTTKAMAR